MDNNSKTTWQHRLATVAVAGTLALGGCAATEAIPPARGDNTASPEPGGQTSGMAPQVGGAMLALEVDDKGNVPATSAQQMNLLQFRRDTSLRVPVVFEWALLDPTMDPTQPQSWIGCPVLATVVDRQCDDAVYGGVGGASTICRMRKAAQGNPPVKGKRDRIRWVSRSDCTDDNDQTIPGCVEHPQFKVFIHEPDKPYDDPSALVDACMPRRCNGVDPKTNVFDGSCAMDTFNCRLRRNLVQPGPPGSDAPTRVLRYTIEGLDNRCAPLDPYIIVRP